MEFGETPEECAERELLEETGLKVKNLQSLTFTNDYMPAEGKHYVTLFTVCVRQNEKQPPQVLEPEKCEGWEWISWKELKTWAQNEIDTPHVMENGLQLKIFVPLLNIIRQRPEVVPAIG
jgi:8-oxo-dGTP diphosphatase